MRGMMGTLNDFNLLTKGFNNEPQVVVYKTLRTKVKPDRFNIFWCVDKRMICIATGRTREQVLDIARVRTDNEQDYIVLWK